MLRSNVKTVAIAIAVLIAVMIPARASDQPAMDAALHQIAVKWARITYQVKDHDARERQMQALATRAAQVVAQYPDRAEPLVWQGVVVSSEARYAGIFSALGLAKDARAIFEKAGRIDYRALDGAVPTSLGTLYFMVPGFPISFGDNDKARQYLEQGVAIDPTGLDSNYFYGDFLYHQGDYAKAATSLKRALDAPADPTRPVWDAGRRAEARALLAKLTQKLASYH